MSDLLKKLVLVRKITKTALNVAVGVILIQLPNQENQRDKVS